MNVETRSIPEFVQRWAVASLAARNREHLVAAVRFIAAATVAPTEADETRALERAWICTERMRGQRSELEDAPERRSHDGHLGAEEHDGDGYGHGV